MPTPLTFQRSEGRTAWVGDGSIVLLADARSMSVLVNHELLFEFGAAPHPHTGQVAFVDHRQQKSAVQPRAAVEDLLRDLEVMLLEPSAIVGAPPKQVPCSVGAEALAMFRAHLRIQRLESAGSAPEELPAAERDELDFQVF